MPLVAVCAADAPAAIATASPPGHIQVTTPLAGARRLTTSDNAGVGAVLDSQEQTIEAWMARPQRAAQRFVDAVRRSGDQRRRAKNGRRPEQGQPSRFGFVNR
jgi:hypothetical protein